MIWNNCILKQLFCLRGCISTVHFWTYNNSGKMEEFDLKLIEFLTWKYPGRLSNLLCSCKLITTIPCCSKRNNSYDIIIGFEIQNFNFGQYPGKLISRNHTFLKPKDQ